MRLLCDLVGLCVCVCVLLYRTIECIVWPVLCCGRRLLFGQSRIHGCPSLNYIIIHVVHILLSFINILLNIHCRLLVTFFSAAAAAGAAVGLLRFVSPITNLYNRTATIITIISQASRIYAAGKRQESEGPSSIEASDSSITLGCH